MKLAAVALFIGSLLIVFGCGGGETSGQAGFGAVGGNEPAPPSKGGEGQEFQNVRAVTQALDKHELTRQILRPTNPTSPRRAALSSPP